MPEGKIACCCKASLISFYSRRWQNNPSEKIINNKYKWHAMSSVHYHCFFHTQNIVCVEQWNKIAHIWLVDHIIQLSRIMHPLMYLPLRHTIVTPSTTARSIAISSQQPNIPFERIFVVIFSTAAQRISNWSRCHNKNTIFIQFEMCVWPNNLLPLLLLLLLMHIAHRPVTI